MRASISGRKPAKRLRTEERVHGETLMSAERSVGVEP